MGIRPGPESPSPYDDQGGRCCVCAVNIPRHLFHKEVRIVRGGSFRHRRCGNQIRLFPRCSGTRRSGIKAKQRRESQIKRIE